MFDAGDRSAAQQRQYVDARAEHGVESEVVATYRHDQVVLAGDVVVDESVLSEEGTARAAVERGGFYSCVQAEDRLAKASPFKLYIHPVRDVLSHAWRLQNRLVSVARWCAVTEPELVVQAAVASEEDA